MAAVHYFGLGGAPHGRDRAPLACLVPFGAAVAAGAFAPMLLKGGRNAAGYAIGLSELVTYLKVCCC